MWKKLLIIWNGLFLHSVLNKINPGEKLKTWMERRYQQQTAKKAENGILSAIQLSKGKDKVPTLFFTVCCPPKYFDQQGPKQQQQTKQIIGINIQREEHQLKCNTDNVVLTITGMHHKPDIS